MSTIRATPCLVALTACGPSTPSPAAPSHAPAAAEPSTEVAFLRTAEGAVEIAVPGGARTLQAASDVGWCAVDDRARVVWLTRRAEEERELAARAISPARAGSSPRPIPDVAEIIVDHGEAGRLGGADPSPSASRSRW